MPTMFSYLIDHELELRILQQHHAKALFKLTIANRHFIRQYLPWADDVQSIESSQYFIKDGLQQFARNDGFQAGIWYGDALSGVIGFHSIDWNNDKAEIGYWLGEEYTGKGIMTRACHAITDYAFNTYQLHRVEIRCASSNVKSRAIPERLGFKQEGVLREQAKLHDSYVDHIIYGMLAREWNAS